MRKFILLFTIIPFLLFGQIGKKGIHSPTGLSIGNPGFFHPSSSADTTGQWLRSHPELQLRQIAKVSIGGVGNAAPYYNHDNNVMAAFVKGYQSTGGIWNGTGSQFGALGTGGFDAKVDSANQLNYKIYMQSTTGWETYVNSSHILSTSVFMPSGSNTHGLMKAFNTYSDTIPPVIVITGAGSEVNNTSWDVEGFAHDSITNETASSYANGYYAGQQAYIANYLNVNLWTARYLSRQAMNTTDTLGVDLMAGYDFTKWSGTRIIVNNSKSISTTANNFGYIGKDTIFTTPSPQMYKIHIAGSYITSNSTVMYVVGNLNGHHYIEDVAHATGTFNKTVWVTVDGLDKSIELFFDGISATANVDTFTIQRVLPTTFTNINGYGKINVSKAISLYSPSTDYNALNPYTNPIATTLSTSNITSVAAKCSLWVHPNGRAYTYNGICVDLTANPDTSKKVISTDYRSGTKGISLTGLTSDTLYHYRAYAYMQGGSLSYGLDSTFRTPAASDTTTYVVHIEDVAGDGYSAIFTDQTNTIVGFAPSWYDNSGTDGTYWEGAFLTILSNDTTKGNFSISFANQGSFTQTWTYDFGTNAGVLTINNNTGGNVGCDVIVTIKKW